MIQILLLAFVPLAMANGYGNLGGLSLGYGDLSGAYSNEGYGKSYEPSYPPQPYKFGYDVKDHYGSTLQQKEEGDAHGNKRGSYGYTDGHGIYRQVDYVADKNGFRASIKTNEPGTDNQDPADVNIHSSAPKIVESPALYKAQSYAAPSYYAAPVLSKGYESLSLGNLGGYGSLGGYGKAQSIPAVYYAKGY